MIKKRLLRPAYFIYVAIVSLLTVQVVIAAGFVEKQKYDGIRINLLGRQRMLTQKISKEVMLYSRKKARSADVLKTMRVFDVTMNGIISGGDVPVDLDMKKFRRMPPVAPGPMLDNLNSIKRQWDEFSLNAAKFLETNDRNSFLFIIEENVNLLAAVDDAVRMMEESFGRRTFFQQVNIISAVMTVFVLLIWLLIMRIRQVRMAHQEIMKLEKILPICASCKRIRGEKMDPYKNESWMNLEEYLKKENDINFSHGLCPACAEKLYPGILDKK